jgi:GT2 family glycosyltransferase
MSNENNNELITVAILNHNGGDKLKKTVQAALKQNYKPIEFLVLDNGSEDGSVDYIRQFEQIRLLRSSTNIGYGAGKNELVRNSNGHYILTLDNDIELPHPEFLSKLLAEFKSLPDVAYLSPLCRDIDKDYLDTGSLQFNRINRRVELSDIQNTGIHTVPRYRGGICFFEKHVFDKLGVFDEIYPFNIDDYDMSARAYLDGFKIYRTTNLTAVHLGVDTRKDIKAITWKTQYQFAGFSRMIWKNYRWYNLLFWWPVSSGWICCKTCRNCVKYRSLKPFFALLKSIGMFIRDFPGTIRLRNKIQKSRIEPRDVFLKIRPDSRGRK